LDNVLEEFSDRGVIWSLHRASIANRFDRVLVMKNGRIVQQGTYDEVNVEGSAFQELVGNE